jgi:hypothetical protein
LLQGFDFGAERHSTNRRAVPGTLRQFELNQFAVIEKRSAPNFVQIVILGSHPETRNRIYTLLC